MLKTGYLSSTAPTGRAAYISTAKAGSFTPHFIKDIKWQRVRDLSVNGWVHFGYIGGWIGFHAYKLETKRYRLISCWNFNTLILSSLGGCKKKAEELLGEFVSSLLEGD